MEDERERRGNLVLVVEGIQEAIKVAEVVLLEAVSDGDEHPGVKALALLVCGGPLTVHQLTCIWGGRRRKDGRDGRGGEEKVAWGSLHSSGWTMIPNVWWSGTSRVSAILQGEREERKGGKGGREGGGKRGREGGGKREREGGRREEGRTKVGRRKIGRQGGGKDGEKAESRKEEVSILLHNSHTRL